MATATFEITPEPKKMHDAISDYVRYFERVMDANSWDDATAAKIFPALLEVGSTALNDLDAKTLSSFKSIKSAITPVETCYREAKVMRYFQCRQRDTEGVEAYVKRVSELVTECYPKFTKNNRDQLVRDRFVHGLQSDLKKATLHQASTKLNEAVQSTMMAETCLLYTSPSPRDLSTSRMPSSA